MELRNHTFRTDNDGNTKKYALQIRDIAAQLFEKLDGTPLFRITGGALIGIDQNKVIWEINDTVKLFSFLRSLDFKVVWNSKCEGAATQADLYNLFYSTLPQYSQIATMPHYPPRKDIYYHMDPAEPDRSKFYELISMFNPATEADYHLIVAAFLTPFWGGAPGQRPTIVIESDGKDDGRGVGKTSLMDTIGYLAGGAVDCQITDDINIIKARLLDGHQNRVVRFDNVKSSKFSRAGIEGLITGQEISGKRMYIGEAKVPNYFTYIFSMNDANMSSDMAQRSMRIKLSRSEYNPTWVARRDELLDSHGQGIRAAIIEHFKQTPCHSETPIRFSVWQHEVLCKVDPKDIAAAVMKQRQDDVNSDAMEAEYFFDHVRSKIESLKQKHHENGDVVDCELEKYNYLIKRSAMLEMLKKYKGGVSRMADITGAAEIRRMKLFQEHRTKAGWHWLWVPQNTKFIPHAWVLGDSSDYYRAPLECQKLKQPRQNVIDIADYVTPPL